MVPGTDGERGSMWCSHISCQRRWLADGPLSLVPVIEPHPHGERTWHPCPTCLENYGPAAELTHALRARTARELLAFG